MSTTTLYQARADVCSSIAAAIPALREVLPHGGRFDLTELKRVAAAAPCVRVAVIGAVPLAEGRQPCIDVDFSAVLVCRGEPTTATSRDAQALVLGTQLCALIPTNTWGNDAAKAPENVSMRNLYTRDIDSHGVAFLGYRWRQRFDIELISPAELNDLLLAVVEYDLAPPDTTIDATDNVTLGGAP